MVAGQVRNELTSTTVIRESEVRILAEWDAVLAIFLAFGCVHVVCLVVR
jgi:hypothetical protein